MKFALFGGWGFAGANLVKYLDACVIAKKSSVEKRPFLKKYFEGVKVVTIKSLNDVERAIEECGADALVYLAGRLKGSYEEMYDAHVRTAKTVLSKAREKGMKAVYFSSIAAVGIADACERGGKVYEEEEHLKGCEPLGPYSETKAEGERLALSLGAGVVRPALIWGEGGYYLEWKLLYAAKRFKFPLPNMSAVTAECLARATEEAVKGGWLYASNATLKDLGFKTFEWRPPKGLIRLAPPLLQAGLLAMRYRYASRRLNC